MPKSIISNLLVEKGKTKFKIFLDKTENELVLKPEQSCEESEKNN